jgi:hypothetical protein
LRGLVNGFTFNASANLTNTEAVKTEVPQGLKPGSKLLIYGTAEAVPLQYSETLIF